MIYDQRSHGRSERAPRASCTIDQLGHDLDAVLRAARPRRPARAGRALDGRHDDHGAGRAAARAVRRAGARRGASSRRRRREVGGAGLPGTFLSRRNPLTRAVGLRRRLAAAAWSRACAGPGHDADLDADPALRLRRTAASTPRGSTWCDSMISANAVDALTDFVDTLGTHDRIAALPGARRLRGAGRGGRRGPADPVRAQRGDRRGAAGRRPWCGCRASGTCRCWSSPR